MDDRWMPPPSAARYHQRVVDLGVDEGDLKPWSTMQAVGDLHERRGVALAVARHRQHRDVTLAHVSLTLPSL